MRYGISENKKEGIWKKQHCNTGWRSGECQISRLGYFYRLLSTIRGCRFFDAVKSTKGIFCKLPPGVIDACRNPDWAGVAKDMAWWQTSPLHHIVTLKDDAYPLALKAISTPPPLLFVRGNVDLLSADQLAIVGSRKPTLVGQETARQMASTLVKQGLGITSGLALGIDAAAHRGAIMAEGWTVAVLGTGIDEVYPSVHKSLLESCAENGAVVTELACGAKPRAQHFPRRNRIVSGLAKGVLVVEASQQSGSLITAKCALDQGRDVFAVPGSIYSEQAQGCLTLIQQGAKCVRDINDILEEYPDYAQPEFKGDARQGFSRSTKHEKRLSDKSFLEHKILAMLSHDPLSLDMILDRLHSDVGSTLAAIQHLQIDGAILRETQGYRLAPGW